MTKRYIHLPRMEDIGSELEDKLQKTISRLSPSLTSLPIALTSRIESTNILAWLKCQEGSPRVYWANRRGDVETGGFGVAMAVVASSPEEAGGGLRRMEKILEASDDDPNLRFIGGHSFYTHTTPGSLWSEFYPLSFSIPELSISRKGDDHYLTIVAEAGSGTTMAQLTEEINATLDIARASIPTHDEESDLEIVSRVDHPNREEWIKNIRYSLDKISRREVDKVVLARRTDLTFSGCVDPFSLLARLRGKEKNCFAFLLEPCPGKAFVSVTPERLFRVTGDVFASEAISGTSGRREDSKNDGGDSLYSKKNLLEHQYVLDDITTRLEDLCESVNLPDERSTYELSNLSHIYSRISGTIRRGVSLDDIISTLHPTPAVGGTPREKALPLMVELEPFDRGWYASPVGVVGQHEVDMAVAIRSAIVEENKASLFAGAGIVTGSQPDSEWQELEQKISHAIEGLNGVSL